MHRIFTALAVMALFASLAFAGDVPTRTTVTNVSSTAQTYTVPNFGNGWLVKVLSYNCVTNDTLTITKVVPVTSTRSVTNACATIVSVTNMTYSLDTSITNEYLVPGDILRFTFASTTGDVCITRLVSSP
jgi:hypothetical protein